MPPHGTSSGSSARALRVVVADELPLLREGYATALAAGGIVVVGEASDARGAIELARRLRPAVVVLDVHQPAMGGLEVIAHVRREAPEARVLVVTGVDRADAAIASLVAGAAGHITKRCTRGEICQAVLAVHAGSSARPAPTPPLLGRREEEVVGLITRGLTDREIAAALEISPRTVQNHLTRVRQKTGLRRRAELTRWAVERGVGARAHDPRSMGA